MPNPQAVNMRGDADTVGAITGQLAGAIYGLAGVPESWINVVERLVEEDGRGLGGSRMELTTHNHSPSLSWDPHGHIAGRALRLYQGKFVLAGRVSAV